MRGCWREETREQNRKHETTGMMHDVRDKFPRDPSPWIANN